MLLCYILSGFSFYLVTDSFDPYEKERSPSGRSTQIRFVFQSCSVAFGAEKKRLHRWENNRSCSYVNERKLRLSHMCSDLKLQ